jgi:formylglycine-generating enzyme required for sulfatase activity
MNQKVLNIMKNNGIINKLYHSMFVKLKKNNSIPTRFRLAESRSKSKSFYPQKSYRFVDMSYTMNYVPPVFFRMGTDGEKEFRDGDTTSMWESALFEHTTYISKPFYMGESLVTMGMWQEIMGWVPGATYLQEEPLWKLKPVFNVTWYDCLIFCNKLSLRCGYTPCFKITNTEHDVPLLMGSRSMGSSENVVFAIVEKIEKANGFRLPTEAEWEYVARYRSNDPFYEESIQRFLSLEEVGAQIKTIDKINRTGFYDIPGNLTEWCMDLVVYNEEGNKASYGRELAIDPMNWADIESIPPSILKEAVKNHRHICRGELIRDPEDEQPRKGFKQGKVVRFKLNEYSFTYRGDSKASSIVANLGFRIVRNI